jgi:hypothetical protein
LAFNNWKYIQLLKREATNKKRKLEPEVTTEVIPESQSIPVEVISQLVVPDRPDTIFTILDTSSTLYTE